MAYSPTYVGSDLGNIFMDLFGFILAVLTENANTLAVILIVALIALYGGRALRSILGIFNSFN